MNEHPSSLRLCAIPDLPIVAPGDDLATLISSAATRAGLTLADGVLVVCQKVVSKAEGRVVSLADIEPSEEAAKIAREDDKDARQVEVVLRESRRIVRRGHRVLITETHHGFVCANAGVDLSNAMGPDTAVLLPEDPDASAAHLKKELEARGHGPIAIIVSDTFGRPWREGLVDQAIGSAGIAPLLDARGTSDLVGRELEVTSMATVDQLAAAAGVLMTKASGHAAVWIEGLPIGGAGSLDEILRDSEGDLFR